MTFRILVLILVNFLQYIYSTNLDNVTPSDISAFEDNSNKINEIGEEACIRQNSDGTEV